MDELKARLLAPPQPFTAIPVERLRELEANILKSQGWEAGETPEERTIIVREWNRMPGYFSFHSAVRQLIREATEPLPSGLCSLCGVDCPHCGRDCGCGELWHCVCACS